jgi:uncharacterized protein Veg
VDKSPKLEGGVSMSGTNALDRIREDLTGLVGQKVQIRANKGRRRIMEAEGVIEGIYPNIFVIKLSEDHALSRVTYSYADVLTETVELRIDNKRIGVGA